MAVWVVKPLKPTNSFINKPGSLSDGSQEDYTPDNEYALQYGYSNNPRLVSKPRPRIIQSIIPPQATAKWLPVVNGHLPCLPVVIGTNEAGAVLYFARAGHGQDILPGFTVQHTNFAEIVSGDQVFSSFKYEVYCHGNHGSAWQMTTAQNSLPQSALICGVKKGIPILACRGLSGRMDKIVSSGYVHPYTRQCLLGNTNGEPTYNDVYEVLVKTYQ